MNHSSGIMMIFLSFLFADLFWYIIFEYVHVNVYTLTHTYTFKNGSLDILVYLYSSHFLEYDVHVVVFVLIWKSHSLSKTDFYEKNTDNECAFHLNLFLVRSYSTPHIHTTVTILKKEHTYIFIRSSYFSKIFHQSLWFYLCVSNSATVNAVQAKELAK